MAERMVVRNDLRDIVHSEGGARFRPDQREK
jgi:hypothetical protein